MISWLANNFVVGTLSVLASGYLLHEARLCRLIWPMYAGYILYFRTITVGLFFLFFLYFLYVLLEKFTPFIEVLKINAKDVLLLTFPLALFLRILLEALTWLLCKCSLEWKDKLQLKILDERGFDKFIYEKIRDWEMVMITLESGKVYVGWPLATPINENAKWLRLVPQLSGHRNAQLEVSFQVNYSKVFGDEPSDQNHMLIPSEKIVTAQPFDIEVFEKFNNGGGS